MKKMNKKGFTLVEMLVVIAIIAILVAVIIPTVSSSTTKAKAATDVANLRSALATATIKLLDDDSKTSFTYSELSVPQYSKLYPSEEFSCTVSKDATTGELTVTVKYGTDHDIDHFASKAGNSDSGSSAASTTGNP